jgi:hypothetical protein
VSVEPRVRPWAWPRVIAIAPGVIALLLASAAVAEPPADDTPDTADETDGIDLALEANNTLQEFCAELYAADVQQAAESYTRVGETWGAVDGRFGETREPYWLYWRGLLAECLGQYDQACGDLEAFLAEHGDNAAYADLSRDARRRLRRLTDMNEGRSSARVGKRRAPIAFLEDPRAAETLGRVELQRYRRSGLTLDQWQERRLALKRRVVLMWSLGAELGPQTAVIHEVVLPEESGHYRVASLATSWYFRSSFGIEAWPTDVFSLGWLVGIHRSDDHVGFLHATRIDDVVEEPGSYDHIRFGVLTLDNRIWTGFTFLPLRRFKPLIRLPMLGLRLRPQSDGVAPGGEYSSPWFLALGVGGFAGFSARLSPVLGLEAGVWFLLDLTDNEAVETNLDPDDLDHLSFLVPVAGRLSIRPSLALRLVL